jgi:hypothetical protein
MNNPASAAAQATTEQALTLTAKGGNSWFFWIAGGSVVNSVLAMTNGKISLIVGLGITQIVDAVLADVAAKHAESNMVLQGIGLAISIVIAALFVGFGILGNKKQTWAIILGMVIYAIDALIFLIGQDWLSIGFHGFALFRLYAGLQATMALNKIKPATPPAA